MDIKSKSHWQRKYTLPLKPPDLKRRYIFIRLSEFYAFSSTNSSNLRSLSCDFMYSSLFQKMDINQCISIWYTLQQLTWDIILRLKVGMFIIKHKEITPISQLKSCNSTSNTNRTFFYKRFSLKHISNCSLSLLIKYFLKCLPLNSTSNKQLD